jgi:hypothetical protein
MSNVTFALYIIGIAVLATGCGQRPSGGPLRASQNGTQAEVDQPDEAARVLAEFEKGTASGSEGERTSAVYALDKYVRNHAIVVDRLIEMLRSHTKIPPCAARRPEYSP